MRISVLSVTVRVTGLLFLASLLGLVLFLVGVLRNGDWTHWFLLWNLVLAWVPFLLALMLVDALEVKKRWNHWWPISLTILWLTFLPNAFYMVTDYIHLNDVERVDYNFDALMFTVLIMTGLALGLSSMVLVHWQVRRRLPGVSAGKVIAAVLFLTSFAIYMGRELRWNTWDLLVNPAGVLFDLSEVAVNPWGHAELFVITFSYFAGLSLLYYGTWRVVQVVRKA
jgi:uncharacterized membrane protein